MAAVAEMTDQVFFERLKAFFKGIFGEKSKPATKIFSEAEVEQIAIAIATQEAF